MTIKSCEYPDCMDLATVHVVVSHSGKPGKASYVCPEHISDGLLQLALLSNELVGSNNHIQVLIFSLT